jgi:NAD(P)-dependent dehydrogenase (short-subunit alcohol dehydrogenase family)
MVSREHPMQRILVTGAARGIGFEFVRRFLARGERVFAVVRRQAGHTRWAELAGIHPGRLTVLTLDVAELDHIAAFAHTLSDHTDALDLLINNAGQLPSGERFGNVEASDLDQTFRINAAAPLLLTQALTPMLARGHQPKVLNISTELASIAHRRAFSTPSYCISKAALNMATRLMSFELATRGIGCAAVHPGWVKTEMGGPNAPVMVEDSVRALIAFVEQLSPEQYGGFFASDGTPLPW